MIDSNTKLIKNEDIAWRQIDDDAILIDIDEEEVTHFNASGCPDLGCSGWREVCG